LLFDIADSVDSIAQPTLNGTDAAMARAIIAVASFGLVAKPVSGRHVCGFQAIWIVGPLLRKIQCAIDERVTVARRRQRSSDLAVS